MPRRRTPSSEPSTPRTLLNNAEAETPQSISSQLRDSPEVRQNGHRFAADIVTMAPAPSREGSRQRGHNRDKNQTHVEKRLAGASATVELAQEALKQAAGISAVGVVSDLLKQCEQQECDMQLAATDAVETGHLDHFNQICKILDDLRWTIDSAKAWLTQATEPATQPSSAVPPSIPVLAEDAVPRSSARTSRRSSQRRTGRKTKTRDKVAVLGSTSSLEKSAETRPETAADPTSSDAVLAPPEAGTPEAMKQLSRSMDKPPPYSPAKERATEPFSSAPVSPLRDKRSEASSSGPKEPESVLGHTNTSNRVDFFDASSWMAEFENNTPAAVTSAVTSSGEAHEKFGVIDGHAQQFTGNYVAGANEQDAEPEFSLSATPSRKVSRPGSSAASITRHRRRYSRDPSDQDTKSGKEIPSDAHSTIGDTEAYGQRKASQDIVLSCDPVVRSQIEAQIRAELTCSFEKEKQALLEELDLMKLETQRLRQELDHTDGELKKVQKESKEYKKRNEQLLFDLTEKERSVEHAKDMWLKESTRATTATDNLDELERRLFDKERQLVNLSKRYQDIQQETAALKSLVKGEGPDTFQSLAIPHAETGFLPYLDNSAALRKSTSDRRLASSSPVEFFSVDTIRSLRENDGPMHRSAGLVRRGEDGSPAEPNPQDQNIYIAPPQKNGTTGKSLLHSAAVLAAAPLASTTSSWDEELPRVETDIHRSAPSLAASTAPDGFGSTASHAFHMMGARLGSLRRKTSAATALLTDAEEQNFERFRRLLCYDDAVLYENSAVQLGVKACYRGLTGTLQLFYGNCINGAFQSVSMHLHCDARFDNALTLSYSPLPSQLEPKQQVRQSIVVTCTEPFEGFPLLRLRFLLPDTSPSVLQFPLPICVTKFMEAHVLTYQEFFNYWKHEEFALREVTAIIALDKQRFKGSLLSVARTIQAQGAFALLPGIDKDKDNLVFASVFPPSTTPSSLNVPTSLVLVRYETGRGHYHDVCHVTVRSDSIVLSRSVRSFLMLLLSEPTRSVLTEGAL